MQNLNFAEQFMGEVSQIATSINTKVIDEMVDELIKLREKGPTFYSWSWR